MFISGSRYESQDSVTVTTPDGKTVRAIKIPRFKERQLRGYHQRQDIHRLDHIAKKYLSDATQFWKLCEASESPCPDALAKRSLVAIPTKE